MMQPSTTDWIDDSYADAMAEEMNKTVDPDELDRAIDEAIAKAKRDND